MKSILRPLLSIFVALSVVTGLIYPALVAALAKTAFPDQAAGSIVELNGHAVGSSLIGQPFSDAGHFWSRPSATSPNPYNGLASGGSNLSPTNPALADGVKTRIAALKDADPSLNTPVPIDLVTASASGLDPDISPAAAALQIPRIAKARHLNASDLEVLVSEHTTGRQLGFLGEPRVNVLELNLALDALAKS